MKKTIAYVFGWIITILVSLIFWLIIVGRGNGTAVVTSPLKQMLYGTMTVNYAETYMTNTDNNGRGTTERTAGVWNPTGNATYTMNIEIPCN